MDEKDIKAEPGVMVACLDCLFTWPASKVLVAHPQLPSPGLPHPPDNLNARGIKQTNFLWSMTPSNQSPPPTPQTPIKHHNHCQHHQNHVVVSWYWGDSWTLHTYTQNTRVGWGGGFTHQCWHEGGRNARQTHITTLTNPKHKWRVSG